MIHARLRVKSLDREAAKSGFPRFGSKLQLQLMDSGVDDPHFLPGLPGA